MAAMDTASGKDPVMVILNETVVEAFHKSVMHNKLLDKVTVIDTIYAAKIIKKHSYY